MKLKNDHNGSESKRDSGTSNRPFLVLNGIGI
jgi:hypothetical protein